MLAAIVVLVLFAPTLIEEPLTAIALVVVLAQSVVLDWLWKRSRGDRPPASDPAPTG
jgi:hypothetical protein